MLMDRPVGLEAEHRDEEVGLVDEHLSVDADAALERQRTPFGPLEGLSLQFQTLTSR